MRRLKCRCPIPEGTWPRNGARRSARHLLHRSYLQCSIPGVGKADESFELCQPLCGDQEGHSWLRIQNGLLMATQPATSTCSFECGIPTHNRVLLVTCRFKFVARPAGRRHEWIPLPPLETLTESRSRRLGQAVEKVLHKTSGQLHAQGPHSATIGPSFSSADILSAKCADRAELNHGQVRSVQSHSLSLRM